MVEHLIAHPITAQWRLNMATTGKCLCGAIEVTLNKDPKELVACYCTSCQKASGSAASFNIVMEDDACDVSRGVTKIFKDTADSGADLERHFCGDCGSPIYGVTTSYSGKKIFRAALFSEEKDMHVVTNIWTDSAPEWAALHQGVPSHGKSRS